MRLSDDELQRIGTRDDCYLTLDSVKFPYVRFEIEVAEGCEEGVTVEVEWTGRTLTGRRVTMYAWHYETAAWVPLASRVAESEDDFTLCGVVGVAEYVRDGRVNVLVQDLIAAGGEAYDFTFILMPDSQMYSMVHPGDYDVQTNWIKDQREAMNIKYVAHVGDVVDVTEEDYQWQNASRSMRVLEDAGIPYGITTGNHDVGCGHRVSTLNYTPFCTYFGEARFKGKAYYGGSYLNNRGHYDLISAGGVDFVIVYMGWNYTTVMDDEDVAWINGVLAGHRNRKAILVHHDYLGNSGERSVRGEYLFQHIVVPNANVVMTMNGHFHGSAVRVDVLDDDGDGVAERRVNQISGVKGVGLPNGNLRLLHFDVAGGKVHVKTYSPTLGEYNAAEEVVLEMDLAPQVKRVATRYAEVCVFAERPIGEVVCVPATEGELGRGQVAEVTWNGLKAWPAGSGSYGWYVKAADSYGGVALSELQGLAVE
jgi:hypothetical protein